MSALIVYGANCSWFDVIAKAATLASGIPCCPFCKSVLFQVEEEVWWAGAKTHEADGHPGYEALLRWAQGKCFRNMHAAQRAYAAALDMRRSCSACAGSPVRCARCAGEDRASAELSDDALRDMVTTYGARSVTLFQALARHVGVQGALDRVHEAAVTIKTAVNALRAERDGLRSDLARAIEQREAVSRELASLRTTLDDEHQRTLYGRCRDCVDDDAPCDECVERAQAGAP